MSAEEREWWDSLEGDEITNNTAGNPPYDVEVTANFLDSVLEFGDRALDLGCGVGRLTKVMALRHPETFFLATDIAPSFVDLVNTAPPMNVLAIPGDGRTIPTTGSRAGTFTAAYSVTVFQHIPHEAVADYIRQVHSRLRPGGRFAFTWAEGTEDVFLSHQTKQADVDAWCHEAGFGLVSHYDGDPNGWKWSVAVKL